jgi:hypothetical protein
VAHGDCRPGKDDERNDNSPVATSQSGSCACCGTFSAGPLIYFMSDAA